MTFEEAARRYLNAPTKNAGNDKSPIAVHVITWMAQDRPKGLLEKKTGKVFVYSKNTTPKDRSWLLFGMKRLDVLRTGKCPRSIL